MGLHVNHRKAILAAGVAIGAIGTSTTASAQTTAATGAAETSDIIVTANKREERLFEVAASMTAVGSEELVNLSLIHI
jgi:iron complex outermembrane receptor protein